ncbi:MAG: hypothetical protein KGL39_57905 [Patescibacteria group bacterium]|nr:hypothetical protein [Patescibacteria group bacterium]
MDESARANSIADFERGIYPIWKGIEEKDIHAENKMSLEEVKAQRVLFECLTLHKQDLAIYQSNIKPFRESGDREKMNELRRKALKATGI